jgi:Rad3-related DNA helicase
LFALIRGKISEGLDFADEKCRAVIIVGVPYPARNDIKVVSKMHYLN